MSSLTLFQECQPIPLTGFQSTAGGDVLNFDELMHKDCRNSWKCKKNKITVRHKGVFLGCRKIQILSAADLQEVGVYSKAQALWKMLPKNYLRKNISSRMACITWSAAWILNLALLKGNKKKYFFFPFPLCALCCWQSISLGDSADWAIWKCDWPDKSPFVYSPQIFPQTFLLDSRIFLYNERRIGLIFND